MAQEVSHWHGRAFLPLVHGVGIGGVAETSLPPEVAQDPAMLVMQLADGTLKDRTFEGEALEMVSWALASTLALLNASGFIHGDLKPSNVLWQTCCDTQLGYMLPGLDGWPLLTDFGSAQAFSTMHPNKASLGVSDKIRTGGWTEAYAAPEVIVEGGKWQTIRSDMFSWAQTIRAVSKHPGNLPPNLHKLCEGCVNADPELRPASFAEIADTIEWANPACLRWGRMLWEQQQAYFESATHAQKLSNSLCRQGLRILVDQRQKISEDRLAEADAVELLANQYSRIGHAIDAKELLQKALKVDPRRAASVSILGNLGNAYGDLGDAATQRDLLERALKIQEAYFGEDHKEVAIILANLGNAYGDLGDAAKRRDLLERALKIQEAYFGENHKEVASTLANLGNAYGSLGDAAKRRDLLERALKIKEAYFGENHKEVASTLANLGNAYGSLGDAAKQRDLLERALKIKEAYFGEDHKKLASTLANLGNAYGSLGDAARQRDLLERALKIKEAYFGEDHKEVASTLASLGNAYGSLGDAAKQRDLLERALKMEEAYFGENHKEVASTLASLGNAYGSLGDAARQRDLLERALKIKEAYFGEDHKEVASTLANLGNAYGSLGDAAKQRDLLERALKIREAYFGEEQFEVAKTLHNLGIDARHIMESYEAAKETCERALQIFVETRGPEHPYAVKTHSHLRDVLQKYEASWCLLARHEHAPSSVLSRLNQPLDLFGFFSTVWSVFWEDSSQDEVGESQCVWFWVNIGREHVLYVPQKCRDGIWGSFRVLPIHYRNRARDRCPQMLAVMREKLAEQSHFAHSQCRHLSLSTIAMQQQ